MLTLESTIAVCLAILLVLAVIAVTPPAYQMARCAARLEVLSVYESMAGSALYQTGPLSVRSAGATGLQTSPQKITELVSWVQDYSHWVSRWLDRVVR